MHLLATETHSLDAAEAAMDLGQTRADLVFLSFSDSDLGALASAWQAMDEAERPSLRLANLGRLRHPMSVDLYLDRVVAHARCVVVRLLGALEYFRYGAEEISALCVREGIPLAFVPGDGRDDAQLASLSTVPPHQRARLDAYLREGGPLNAASALRLAASLAGLCADANLPALPMASAGEFALASVHDGRPVAAVIFYRAHLLAGDTAPITALAAALAKRGLQPRALYVSSLKDAEAAATVREYLNAWRPAVILNATAFAARTDGGGSPLDIANVPVLQVMLSGSTREAWAASSRGASANDLAMQVVLPELDGRLFTTAISFKSDNAAVAELEYARVVHRPDADGIALAAERAAGWVRLARTPRAERRVAIVLSDYPAAGQRAHAVGLDTFASAEAMLADLRDAGYNIGHMPPNGALRGLMADAQPVRLGNVVLAVQPARDDSSDPRRTYHSADAPPCERYTAFYRWLRETFDAHVMVHLGTHGTLEWLPGKAVALTASCAPVALIGGLPVVYPFIVNNPGEAAMAKRRLGAVVIGHLTPPLRRAGAHGDLGELERSIDEYAAADGLDRRRTASLRRDILDRAASLGIAEEAGIAADAPEDDALARLDAYLCDVKELQVRDGLHVFGRAPAPPQRAALLASLCAADPVALDASPGAERASLLAALDGRFVPPGPAGSPTRSRADVLPTGRNLTAIDPRGMPTPTAMTLAHVTAADILRRHRQDHGDWPRALLLNLWGSAAMRTGGEDLALALVLLGARPVWDGASSRVTGVEILPLAVLDRPRVDVSLRISGLFRDMFPAQITLFNEAVRAIAARDESPAWNPLAGLRDAMRIFAPHDAAYGAGPEALLQSGDWSARAQLGEAFLARASDREAFAERVAAVDAFVLTQDHRDTDVLDGNGIAAHAGGFAAAHGDAAVLYHADTSRPHAPRTRLFAEEIALVARGRLANPQWLTGMMRHGYRGAAEIARGVEGLCGCASTMPTRFDRQFDLVWDATLGDPDVDRFLRTANPDARADMIARLRDMQLRGLWQPRRNAVGAMLDSAA